MTNVFVGPESLQKVTSSFFKVPFLAKFRFRDISNIEVRANQRMFFAVPTKKDPVTGEDRVLRRIPSEFMKFKELYRMAYDQKAVSDLIQSDENVPLEDILFTGITVHLWNPEKSIFERVGYRELQEKELYKETQLSQVQRLFSKIFPTYHPVPH